MSCFKHCISITYISARGYPKSTNLGCKSIREIITVKIWHDKYIIFRWPQNNLLEHVVSYSIF